MKKLGLVWFYLSLVFGITPMARADVLVLIHGYLSDATVWDSSGVTAALRAQGWQAGGITGVNWLLPGPAQTADRRYYQVSLPSTAPLLVQTEYLLQQLRSLQATYPDQAFTLIGHSAGGVVARLLLLHPQAPKVKALITIASPHLGTARAEQALDATYWTQPVSPLIDFFGGPLATLRHSEGLLVDLIRPRPGNLLHWLNHQPHPQLAYYAIVRGSGPLLLGDDLVPPISQDLNQVPALRGKAQVITVPAEHGLTPQDGWALQLILQGLSAS